MSRPNILTVRDLPPKVIVDAYRVILIVLPAALPGNQSKKRQRMLTAWLVRSSGRWAGVFSCRRESAGPGIYMAGLYKLLQRDTVQLKSAIITV